MKSTWWKVNGVEAEMLTIVDIICEESRNCRHTDVNYYGKHISTIRLFDILIGRTDANKHSDLKTKSIMKFAFTLFQICKMKFASWKYSQLKQISSFESDVLLTLLCDKHRDTLLQRPTWRIQAFTTPTLYFFTVSGSLRVLTINATFGNWVVPLQYF